MPDHLFRSSVKVARRSVKAFVMVRVHVPEPLKMPSTLSRRAAGFSNQCNRVRVSGGVPLVRKRYPVRGQILNLV